MTFTRLTLGEPRLKGVPKGGPAAATSCQETNGVGNLMPAIDALPGGPTGYEIPQGISPNGRLPGDGASKPYLRWADGSSATDQLPTWANWVVNTEEEDPTTQTNHWIISSADPYGGNSSHLRSTAGGAFGHPYALLAINTISCRGNDWFSDPTLGYEFYPGITGHIGDIFELTVVAKADAITSPTRSITLDWEAWGGADYPVFDLWGGGETIQLSSTSYTTYNFAPFSVPPEAGDMWFLNVQVYFPSSGGALPSTVYDIGEITLTRTT